jgi:hypothetical protein
MVTTFLVDLLMLLRSEDGVRRVSSCPQLTAGTAATAVASSLPVHAAISARAKPVHGLVAHRACAALQQDDRCVACSSEGVLGANVNAQGVANTSDLTSAAPCHVASKRIRARRSSISSPSRASRAPRAVAMRARALGSLAMGQALQSNDAYARLPTRATDRARAERALTPTRPATTTPP